MGICLSSETSNDEPINILLLGAPLSGKSTLCKQFSLLYGGGISIADKKTYISIVRQNVLSGLRTLVKEARKRQEDAKEEKISKLYQIDYELEKTIDELEKPTVQIETLAEDLKSLWNSNVIQRVYEHHRSAINFDDNVAFFLDRISEVASFDYIPSIDHVMRTRARTAGLNKIHFTLNDREFTVIDVGGQLSERRKWKRAYATTTSVLFIVGTSCYDQSTEDSHPSNPKNQLVESMQIFEEVLETDELSNASLILFLNKRDIFEEKIKKVSIKECPALVSYDGDTTDYKSCMKHIEICFLSLNRKGRDIYVHETCAIDTENVDRIFQSVSETIMTADLHKGGLLVS